MVERIRTLLESRQLTPTQFADLIGVARPIISHILSGRNKPSLDVVQRILAAMPDLSMAWLLNGTEPMLTTAWETAPVTSAPRSAEVAGSPPLIAAPQPIVVMQPPVQEAPVEPLIGYEAGVNQVYKANGFVSETERAVVARPTVPPAPATATSAGDGAMVQPMSPTPRPPMPRRFSVKPAAVEQPVTASVAGLQMPIAPVTGTAIAAEKSAAAAMADESFGKEGVNLTHNASSEPWALANNSLPGAASVRPAEPEAVAPPSMLMGMPPVGMPTPAPAPMPVAGPAPTTTPSLASDMASALFTGAEKPIRRIVIFYRDGSFADYQPE